MSADRKIKDSIEQLVGNFLTDKVKMMFGNVESIQNDDAGFPAYCTVTPISENATTDIQNVALQADISDGELKVPVVGSTVIVAYSKYNNPFLAFVSDIDTYYYYGNKWQQGDGSYGGWVKVIDLVTKLNNLENKVNALITAINTGWTPVPNDGGAALKVALASWLSSNLTPTARSDIENTETAHGA